MREINNAWRVHWQSDQVAGRNTGFADMPEVAGFEAAHTKIGVGAPQVGKID